MNDFRHGRDFSFSLKYKILLGVLSSILPMVAIVVITHDASTQSVLSSCDRQITLVGKVGAAQLNGVFFQASETFTGWTKEDVFGSAIASQDYDDIQDHFATLQGAAPNFHLLLLTDRDGKVLVESNSSANAVQGALSLEGDYIPDVPRIAGAGLRAAQLVQNKRTSPSGRDAPTLLYTFQTTDKNGVHNGYFLAYMDLDDLHPIIRSIRREMGKSGYETSRVAVIDTTTEEIVAFSGPRSNLEEWPFGPSFETLLARSIPGRSLAYRTAGVTEHIAVAPMDFSGLLAPFGVSGKDNPPLVLILAVDEKEIMAGVHRTLTVSTLIGVGGVLVIIMLGYFTVRSITGPISNLVTIFKRYAGGDTSVRAEVKNRDEIGYLSNELNSLLEKLSASARTLTESECRYRRLFQGLQDALNNQNYQFRFDQDEDADELVFSLNRMLSSLEDSDKRVQDEDWLKTGLTLLSEYISGASKLEELCQKAVSFIADYTGSLVGTLFVKRHEEDQEGEAPYELIASYAFKRRRGLANRYRPGEGLIGQAVLEKEIIHFTDIPKDYIRIESSLGKSTPTSILVIPLVYEGKVEGVIELGTSFLFTKRYFKFAEQVSGLVAVAIQSALANQRLKSLLDKTEKQSDALRKQQDELQEANSELEEQTEILRQSESRLQVQQEELQASNEEMEEKNQMLEEQKRENEQTNRNLRQKQQELEEQARQLELATKYKSEFLSNMSHELRTPLNSILLLAKMLAENEEKNLSDDQIESAASIHRGGQTLLHLINDILDLSKIEAGKIELSIGTVRPESIIKDFEVEFNHIAKSKGLDFVTELGEGLPETLVTDAHRLAQIIRNLLGNAFKFTDTGSVTLAITRPGTDWLSTREDLQQDQAIAISVRDTGPGIPSEKCDLIFEAFKQVDGSISRRHGGTGLGLSISRELAKLIGGELQVKSSEHEGATFTLLIPAILGKGEAAPSSPVVQRTSTPPPQMTHPFSRPVAPKTTPPAPPSFPEPHGDDQTTRRMLIIEDDPEFASILQNFFKKNGYEPLMAATGELGVKYAIEYMPTAIILDIGLPGIDGWTVLNELKNNPGTRHIPVHIMSAYDEASQGLKQGAVGYLTKPVDIDGLKSALGKIEHVLENPVKELLIVEDDSELRNSILKMMGARDIRATTAETGRQAIDGLRSNHFDCMILDLGLPDISGFTLLDEIEKDPLIDKLPVIIYTGRDLTRQETERLESYSSSIVLKSALSMERLLDETALFMHRVEEELPEPQQRMIRGIREKDSSVRGKKVLLVDDDMRNAFALSKFLKSREMEVKIADNGQKALEILETEEIPDIVLMDIMMPVMDGYEAMKKIRQRPQLKDLPILALTAKAMETDREECIRCGANDYLSKPIDTEKLLSMMRIWMY